MNCITRTGKISICRTGNQENPRPIRISIRDVLIGRKLVEISLTLEDFALALTGVSECPCECSWRASVALLGDEGRERGGHCVYCGSTDGPCCCRPSTAKFLEARLYGK